ncbi:MAG: efflux RND transporter periplasmic adaptor subunit [Anaerolineales bacterium]|nr:efflux RND transporter periplasmic adaptor subunit [Anaerolineales bacterium]
MNNRSTSRKHNFLNGGFSVNNRLLSILVVLGLLAILLSACASIPGRVVEKGAITASGTISARQVAIAPEIGGKVVEVLVEEGQPVKAGGVLFRLDDALLQAQREQATAAVQVAEAALSAARVQQESAQTQYDLALQAARQQDQQNRVNTWQAEVPEEFILPVWYFEKDEELTAAEKEVAEAEAALESELANLDAMLASASSANFVAAEERLAEAQAAFVVARQVLDRAEQAQDNQALSEQAQKQLDSAQAQLSAAQEGYNSMLTSAASQDVLEARARVAVARARYDAALDQKNALQTGENSLQVKAAWTGLAQAEAAVSQAEAGLAQAQAALNAINIQIAKVTVTSPIDGILLTRNLEVGETVSPGSTLMTIGQLDEVKLVVYIPEYRYGEINLGEKVEVRVDSFPGKTFNGTVAYISDQAEFTPRNVQTVEGRRATVYAVKLSVPNLDLMLKPGMPADVTFLE